MSDFPAPTTPALPSVADFASFYLYGLTSQPYQQSADLEKFGQLIPSSLATTAGLASPARFTPTSS